jgi:hypothetical protein
MSRAPTFERTDLPRPAWAWIGRQAEQRLRVRSGRARAIVDSHHADCTVLANPDGGLTVTVAFAAASALPEPHRTC